MHAGPITRHSRFPVPRRLCGRSETRTVSRPPRTTLSLAELRASQINGCGVCLDGRAVDQVGPADPPGGLLPLATPADATAD
jgi:hypothetical protein